MSSRSNTVAPLSSLVHRPPHPPPDKVSFGKYKESELKHGRVAMLAFLGIVAGEMFPLFFGSDITGPAIYQYQQAEGIFPAWSANVVGLTMAVEVGRCGGS